MRKEKISPYLFLCLALFCTLSFSDQASRNVRRFSVSSIAPTWSFCERFRAGVLLGTTSSIQRAATESMLQEVEELRRENQALCNQMDYIRQWVLSEDRIEEQMIRMRAIDSTSLEGKEREYLQRRKEHLASILKLQLKALPARVVYRDPCSWSSCIWINLGEKQNRALKETVIAKNSPVVVGNVLVGVVEEVGENQCKVRLVTDANLSPAVRSIRGGRQDQFLLEQVEGILQLLQTRKDVFSSEEEKEQTFAFLQKIVQQLESAQITSYLAKGEIRGSSHPLWRTRGDRLKGMGFNYDFPDEEGPARDLRTGRVLGDKKGNHDLALLKEGDLLVTSGLDGVFPADLEVAIVSRVHKLKEGASSYEIEALAVAENFSELSTVFVLPPLPSL